MTENLELKIKAKKITGFIIHLFWFVVVNIALFTSDYFLDYKITWAYWVTFGWGIGIISHALGVFGYLGLEDRIYNYLNK
jgi:hypothetical protein